MIKKIGVPLALIGILLISFVRSAKAFASELLFSLKGIKLKKLSGDKIIVDCFIELTNPTQFFVKVKKSSIQLLYNNRVISSGYIDPFDINKKSIVTLKTTQVINLSNAVNELKNILDDLQDKSLTIQIKSNINTSLGNLIINQSKKIEI